MSYSSASPQIDEFARAGVETTALTEVGVVGVRTWLPERIRRCRGLIVPHRAEATAAIIRLCAVGKAAMTQRLVWEGYGR